MTKRACLVIAVVFGLLAAPPSVDALTLNTLTPYRFLTSTAFSYFFTAGCNAATCSTLADTGGNVYTSDFAVAWHVVVSGAADGDKINEALKEPDGSTVQCPLATYHSSCPVQGPSPYCWTSVLFGTAWVPAGSGNFLLGRQTNCQATGSWSLEFDVNGSVDSSTPFTMSHNSPYLGISSPTDNELFDLDQNDYTAATVPYVASTSTGNSIAWAVTLNYATSGGLGLTLDALPSFGTTSGEKDDQTYQSEGGQLEATASTTASDGSTIQDCVTFYVDGPQTGIPDTTITNQLNSLYSTGATPDLMMGIGMEESSYAQFLYPGAGPVPEPDLYNGVYGKWPTESPGGGAFIGLMMVPTTDSLAWDWTQNANAAVNSTDYGFVGAKLPAATSMMNWLVDGKKATKQNQLPEDVPAHVGLTPLSSPSAGLENMALVDYGPFAASLDWAQQYYIPVCSSGDITASSKGWTCNNATWSWTVNDQNISPDVVRADIFPSGVDTSTIFGNVNGVGYANDVRSKCSVKGGTC